MQPVTSKVEAIQQWSVPQSIRAVRNFLGLVGFYRQFIKGYASIVALLVQIATLDRFHWSTQAQTSFEHLKQALSEAPVLAFLDFALPFTIETNASGVGMGAVLSQQGHPIAFFSKPFTAKLFSASTYVRELFEITMAVKRWRQYLLGHPFLIIIDHRSLKELLTQAIQSPEQHTYLARLMGYDYQIIYCSGTHNQVMDALSRLPEQPRSSLMTLSVPCLTFILELHQQLEACPVYVDHKNAILQSPTAHPNFTITNNLVLHKRHIWLPRGFLMIPTLLTKYHSTPIGGHMGIAKTFARITKNFY